MLNQSSLNSSSSITSPNTAFLSMQRQTLTNWLKSSPTRVRWLLSPATEAPICSISSRIWRSWRSRWRWSLERLMRKTGRSLKISKNVLLLLLSTQPHVIHTCMWMRSKATSSTPLNLLASNLPTSTIKATVLSLWMDTSATPKEWKT